MKYFAFSLCLLACVFFNSFTVSSNETPLEVEEIVDLERGCECLAEIVVHSGSVTAIVNGIPKSSTTGINLGAASIIPLSCNSTTTPTRFTVKTYGDCGLSSVGFTLNPGETSTATVSRKCVVRRAEQS